VLCTCASSKCGSLPAHWLNELMAELGWDDRHRAYQALRAVLHALRDHLTVD
jgi:uncharacterized protein (DUF2267 family)